MNRNDKNLFEPASLNGVQLSNRMIMAPMTRSRAIGSVPNDLMASYYSQRASAGLLITEGTAPSPNGLGYARIPGIYSTAQIEGWKKVTQAVHQNNGKIFVQLMHVGRIAHAANLPVGAEMIAPSAIAAQGEMWTDALGKQKMETPRAMTVTDIENTIREFVKAAQNAIAAGFDGVELHAANGYLLEQFLNPNSNTRVDQYGGSIENRTRFVLSLAKAVVHAIGKEHVGVRISPYSMFNDMQPYGDVVETYSYLTQELQKLDVQYLHLIDYAARATEEGLQLINQIRNNFKNWLILNGGYDRARAEQALNENADLISFGSTFLANPDLPHRLKNNIPLNMPDVKTFYTADGFGFTDYPLAQTEAVL